MFEGCIRLYIYSCMYVYIFTCCLFETFLCLDFVLECGAIDEAVSAWIF